MLRTLPLFVVTLVFGCETTTLFFVNYQMATYIKEKSINRVFFTNFEVEWVDENYKISTLNFISTYASSIY